MPPDTSKKHAHRIDVSTPAPALKQSPFAALSQLSSAVPTSSAPAASPSPDAGSVPKTATSAAAPKSAGRLILRRETKGRGGKTVVIVSGFATLRDRSDALLHDVEKRLKARLGCGGAVDLDTREVLIQGDRPDAVADVLRELGYDVAGVTAKPTPSARK